MSESIEQLLTVSIATKDRPAVLDDTLRRLHAFGLGGCEVVVCDDGSSSPLSPPSLALFPRSRLVRNPVPKGQAIARNQIAAIATRPFILQLDDDSYPVAGSLEQVVAASRDQANWLAFALALEEPSRGRLATDSDGGASPLRAFVGCAALINRAAFLQLGGYAEWIGGMVEEDELSIRGYVQQLFVLPSTSLRIRHDATETQRNIARIEYLCFRNWTLTWFRYAPFPLVLGRIVRLCAGAVWISARSGRLAAVRGVAAALACWRSALKARLPMSYENFLSFVRLPHALQALSTEA